MLIHFPFNVFKLFWLFLLKSRQMGKQSLYANQINAQKPQSGAKHDSLFQLTTNLCEQSLHVPSPRIISTSIGTSPTQTATYRSPFDGFINHKYYNLSFGTTTSEVCCLYKPTQKKGDAITHPLLQSLKGIFHVVRNMK